MGLSMPKSIFWAWQRMFQGKLVFCGLKILETSYLPPHRIVFFHLRDTRVTFWHCFHCLSSFWLQQRQTVFFFSFLRATCLCWAHPHSSEKNAPFSRRSGTLNTPGRAFCWLSTISPVPGTMRKIFECSVFCYYISGKVNQHVKNTLVMPYT